MGPGYQERHRSDIQDLSENGSRLKTIKLTGKFDIEYEPESSEKIKKTSFFRGTFETHEVVVKKVLKDKDNDYYDTLEFYRRCHDLNGVVRLEIAESFDECHYLAFPVCMGNLEAVFKKDVMGVFKNERELVNLMSSQKLETEDPLVDYRGTLPYKSEIRDLGETLLYIMRLGAYEFKYNRHGYYEDLVNSGLSTLRSEYSQVVTFLMDTKNSVDLEAVLAMPYFWEAEKKTDMIRDTFDLLVDLDTKKLESNNNLVFSGDRSIKVDMKWFGSMKVTKDGKTHDYNTNMMKDLIKITRNSLDHLGEIPPGTDSITLEAYLAKTWPLFFFHVYQYAFSVCPEGSPMRQKYFLLLTF
ncbi:nuclear pore complex protein NUP107 [Tanacetum coccineum]